MNLTGPVRQEWLRTLSRTGAATVCYLAYQTVVCRAEREATAQEIAGLPFVCWLGPHPVAGKLAPELTGDPGSIRVSTDTPLILALWPDENPTPVESAIRETGGRVIRAAGRTIRFVIDPPRIPELARLEAVAWIQTTAPTVSFNNQAQWVIQTGWRQQIPEPLEGRPIWAKGIRGREMVVGLIDNGINTDHDQFSDPEFPLHGPGVFPEHRKIAGYKLFRDAAFGDPTGYHGSGVAATMVGDDSVCGNYSKADGMAPDARVYLVDIARANGLPVVDFDEDIAELLDSVRLGPGMAEPVRQVSCSIGSMALPGHYRLSEASLDAVTWQDKNFLVVWAGGNLGGLRWKTVHPACAKNVLTIGATGNGTAANQACDFSSRGPTRDDRTKPTVVVPGQHLTTADGPGNSCYTSRSGTSYAAPAAGGALALIRQYFRDGWFPSGTRNPDDSIPLLSAALLRALAVTGADSDVGTDSIPNGAVGWGRLNLSSVLRFDSDSTRFSLVDDTVGLSTGQVQEYEFDVTERKPLRVVLAWTDTAAAPEAEIALVNDLNLELISPDQNAYHGNRFMDGQSRANPPDWDERNVEEVVQLNLPLTGRWTIRIRARSVFTRRQPYAFTIKGRIAQPPGLTGSHPGLPIPPGTSRTAFVSPVRPLRMQLSPGSSLSIFTLNGRRVACFTASSGLNAVTWPGKDHDDLLPDGIYFFRLTLPDRNSVLGKLLLAR